MKNFFNIAFIFTIGALVLLTGTASAELAIDQNFQLISKTRSGRTTYDYTYIVNITNNDSDAYDVKATLTSNIQDTVVIDGSVTFGSVSAGGTMTSTDTFTIRQDRRVPFNPSTLLWKIDFLTVNLPPDPGEAGKETVLGIDSDSDGVRDDIQRYIYYTYPENEKVRAALTQLAKEHQGILSQPNNHDVAFDHATMMARHGECLFYIQGESSLDARSALKAAILNTGERSRAYIAYNNTLGGEVILGAPIENWKNSCNFNVDELGGEEKKKQEEAAEQQRQQEEKQRRQQEAAEGEGQGLQDRAYLTSKLESITIFPSSHPLNQNISGRPVDGNSDKILANIGLDVNLFADFGSGIWRGGRIGIPYVAVGANQPKVPITFRGNDIDANYGHESEQGPFPIPLDAPKEADFYRDGHIIAVDVDNGMLYELYNAEQKGDGFEASSAAVFNLNTEEYRTERWTSADAAGLPIFPLLVRYDETQTGKIDHAIRFTLERSKIYQGYVHPARHQVAGGRAADQLPFGGRLRLKSDFDISSFSPTNQVILRAMKDYGIILSDVGLSMYIKGDPNDNWITSDIRDLRRVKVSDFEVVELGQIKEY